MQFGILKPLQPGFFGFYSLWWLGKKKHIQELENIPGIQSFSKSKSTAQS